MGWRGSTTEIREQCWAQTSYLKYLHVQTAVTIGIYPRFKICTYYVLVIALAVYTKCILCSFTGDSALYSTQCILYTLHSISVQCTLYTEHNSVPLYTKYCTIYTVQCTPYCNTCTMNTVHSH